MVSLSAVLEHFRTRRGDGKVVWCGRHGRRGYSESYNSGRDNDGHD